MPQQVMTQEMPGPVQQAPAEEQFAFRSKRHLAAQRALLRLGHGATDTLEPDYFQARFDLPSSETTMLSEFSPEFQDARRDNFQSQVNSLAVFSWNSTEAIPDKNANTEPTGTEVPESNNLMVVTTKLRELYKKQKSADRLYRGFFNLFAQDIGVSAHESDWLKAAEQDPELLQFGDDVLPIDSLAARIDYVYDKNPYRAQKNAVNNSRLRGEKFVQQHGETIKHAIEAFPDLAKQVLADYGITDEQTLTAVKKRFDEAKERVVVTSYLEGLMLGNAEGAYAGSSHAVLINADMLVNAAKENVEHVVFHELWHAVSSQNNVDCREAGSEEPVRKPMGTGVPHATWLREGGTEMLARDTMRKRYDGMTYDSGVYDHEVDLVTNIVDANPHIKALLLEGNFEDMSAGQTPSQLKTSRAVALIEKVYGAGFVELTETTLNNHYAEPDKEKSAQISAKIERLLEYTKNPKYAKKALKMAGVLVATSISLALSMKGGLELRDYMDEAAESRIAAEQPVVWSGTSPEQIRTIVEINSNQGTDTKIGYVKGGFIQVADSEGRTRHYLDPIFLKNEAGEEYVGYMQDGALTFQKLGKQPDGSHTLIAFPSKENLVYGAAPVVREGQLVDELTGEKIGEPATWDEVQEHTSQAND